MLLESEFWKFGPYKFPSTAVFSSGRGEIEIHFTHNLHQYSYAVMTHECDINPVDTSC